MLHAAALVLALLLVYPTYKFFVWSWKLRAFPGPPSYPVLGTIMTQPFLRSVYLWRKKYGPYTLIWGLTKPILVITDPNGARTVLSETGRSFGKGPEYTESFALAFGNGLVTSEGEKHRHDRALLAKYFHRSNVTIERIMGMINANTRAALRQLVDHRATGKEAVDVSDVFGLLTFRCFCQFAINFDFSSLGLEQEKRWADMVSTHSTTIGELIVFGFSMNKWSMLREVRCFEDKITRPIIAERRRLLAEDAEVPDDMLTAMIKDGMDDEDLLAQLLTLLGAGHDTSQYFCSYLSMNLGRYPEVQERVRAEINEVMGDRDEVTEEDINNMRYLRMVMLETLRLYAVIPMLSRRANKDVKLKDCGRVIPEGTMVLVLLSTMNRCEDIWGADAATFNPDRFAPAPGVAASPGQMANALSNDPKKGFLPFGYGSRACVGGNLAQMEAGVFLVHTLRRYRILPEPGFSPKIAGGVSLTSRNGVKVRLESL